MAILTIVFLLLLFVFGLFSTLSTIPTKKIATFFHQVHSSPHQDSLKSKDHNKKKKKEMVVNKKESLDPYDNHSRERKAELKSVFATFDKNKDGFITKQELSDSLKNIGISTSEKDVIEMVQKVDVNGDGLIDFDEFCELFESMMRREDHNTIDGGLENLDHEDGDLKDAFDVFDGDKNGLISVEELGLVLESLGFKEGKKLEDCKMMISKVDIDGDGMINFQEFKNMMKNGLGLISVS